ncbi:hypothetical protein FQR65_LT04851 [Abscondita terminalis]|nr:hypothetical protein FQR65_LT04851 [Abscondita terminalis]
MAAASFPNNNEFGCKHYKRHCRLLAPCCNNAYSCHICHDENENHTVNRFTIVNHLCTNCNEVQPVNKFCWKCEIKFGEYACVVCYMFDDNTKGQFHCLSCGICRIGGAQNYFHCKTCNMCLALRLADNHKCVENCGYGNCPQCAEFLHTTRTELHVPKCGHLIHKSCYEQLLNQQNDCCLVCKEKY